VRFIIEDHETGVRTKFRSVMHFINQFVSRRIMDAKSEETSDERKS
jgi:hypothetical protein